MHRKNKAINLNEGTYLKIANLLSINAEQRPFVASRVYKEEASFLLEQIACQEKAKVKLKTYHKHKCFYTKLSLEQSTHERVAKYKSKLIASYSGNNLHLLSMTGGLGVDDYFLSKYFNRVTSLDIDENLNQLARFNFDKLKAHNIDRLTDDSLNYKHHLNLEHSVLYIDPDRRWEETSNNKKVENFSPNIINLLPEIKDLALPVWIKLPGVIDIKWIQDQVLPSQIWVIAYKNEVKEVLILIHGKFNDQGEVKYVILDDQNEIIKDESSLQELIKHFLPSEGQYIFKPNVAFRKAQQLKNLKEAISPNTNLYFTESKTYKSLGLYQKIIWSYHGSLNKLKKELLKKGITSASVLGRNTKLNSLQLKAFFKLSESIDHQLIVCGSDKGKITAYFTRIEQE